MSLEFREEVQAGNTNLFIYLFIYFDAADSVIFICCVSIFHNFETSPNKIQRRQWQPTPYSCL